MNLVSNDHYTHSIVRNVNHRKCECCHRTPLIIHDQTSTIHFYTSFDEPESESFSDYTCPICFIKNELASLKYQVKHFAHAVSIAYYIATCGKTSMNKRIKLFIKLYNIEIHRH